jgi:hypothetical protein
MIKKRNRQESIPYNEIKTIKQLTMQEDDIDKTDNHGFKSVKSVSSEIKKM